MVGPPGFEPGTNTLWVYCSNLKDSIHAKKILKINQKRASTESTVWQDNDITLRFGYEIKWDNDK